MNLPRYIKARIEEHNFELNETVQTIQKLQERFKAGEPVENAHVRIDNLTKKILVTRSVIAELKHLLEIK